MFILTKTAPMVQVPLQIIVPLLKYIDESSQCSGTVTFDLCHSYLIELASFWPRLSVQVS